MGAPFTHLRVASGYSLQYGASHPSDLVAAAAEQGMDTLALTDRDGLYGAVRFAKACLKQGVAPIVGVDLALPYGPTDPRTTTRRRDSSRSSAAHGGEIRDARLPRIVTLAASRRGWSDLCHLVTDTHLAGDRGRPVTSVDLVAERAAGGELVVMLGADSPVGLAAAAGRRDHAESELRRILDVVEPANLVVAVTDHRIAGRGVGSARQAAALLDLAEEHHLTTVLTNQVRMVHRRQAAVVDILDAARRLEPLDLADSDRRTAECYLKATDQMAALAREITRAGGRDAREADHLLGRTRELAARCRLDPRADIGLGEIHLPEFDVLGAGVTGTGADTAMRTLRQRCEAGVGRRYPHADTALLARVEERLGQELGIIDTLGFASYFLAVDRVVGLIREMGVRCAARGSGAGSLVNHLLGISGVDPLAHDLVMERFLSPLRRALPDIDLDVESARRPEIYQKVLDTFGGRRVAAVAMIDTYRVRHAVRDVGAALSLPPGEIDAIAKAFPHIRARDARSAIRDLPELRSAGLQERRLDVLFDLVEALDGLPRHLALHPCGIILSDTTLGDRTPVEASFDGIPKSQFDKDDVEDMGLLKLDVLGVRMQSSMAHAIREVERTEGVRPDIDALEPFDDPPTWEMIRSTATLGCFQIESPGQRELIGKFGPETFDDIIIDISLFRPGPVKSDMVIPFLNARQGWSEPSYLHPSLVPVLEPTRGVVVFHEQIIQIISVVTGCSLARGDEARRELGDLAGQEGVREWLWPLARDRGYDDATIERIWQVLESFASFGFCKAHAAAFALPTYQSAWLKRHYPAQFLAGLLTHDPGMYPRRLLLEEARRMNIAVCGVDINASTGEYTACRVDAAHVPHRRVPDGLPDAAGWGIRLSLADVRGIAADEVERIVSGQPYTSLTDFWERARVEQPVVERLIMIGALDQIYDIAPTPPDAVAPTPTRQTAAGALTRRDLLLALADLHRGQRAGLREARRARGLTRRPAVVVGDDPRALARRQTTRVSAARVPVPRTLFDDPDPDSSRDGSASDPGVGTRAGASRLPSDVQPTGLPDLTASERLSAELDVLGLDASQHIIDFHRDLLDALGTAHSTDLLGRRNHSVVLVGGVKVATQTPPIRSGRRVVFLTIDDATGPVDATFFEDAQAPHSATVFSSWLLLVRGQVRRTGPRGVSLLATGAWDLQQMHEFWRQEWARTGSQDEALDAVRRLIDATPTGSESRRRPSFALADWDPTRSRGGAGYDKEGERRGAPGTHDDDTPDTGHRTRAGGMGQRRVLVHASGFLQSPYADVQPSGVPASQAPPASVVPDDHDQPGRPAPMVLPPSAEAPRKLWHSSPGSSGR